MLYFWLFIYRNEITNKNQYYLGYSGELGRFFTTNFFFLSNEGGWGFEWGSVPHFRSLVLVSSCYVQISMTFSFLLAWWRRMAMVVLVCNFYHLVFTSPGFGKTVLSTIPFVGHFYCRFSGQLVSFARLVHKCNCIGFLNSSRLYIVSLQKRFLNRESGFSFQLIYSTIKL
jgi:hypothetical protein